MINLKKTLKKLAFIPLWLICILTLISAVALTAVFVKGLETSPIAYVVYVLSFYTLCTVCVFFWLVFPKWKNKIKTRVYNNKFCNRYLTDVAFRTHVSLYISLAINMLYVAVNVLFVAFYKSFWFAILAVYYAILGIMHFLLLRFVNRIGIGKNKILEFRRSRLCGIILMTINLTLSGAVLMMLYQNRGYEYHGILIYIMAMYTFYITVTSIIDIVKYRKYNSPIMSTSKIIGLSAALVSMLSLETAMLSEFGADTSPETKRILIALTGAGVSVIVITMSIYMIIRATTEIRNFKKH